MPKTEQSKKVGNVTFNKLCLSGPTKEDNSRVELTGKDVVTSKKIHVFTLHKARNGDRYAEVARAVYDEFSKSSDPISKIACIQMKDDLLST